MKLNFLYNVNNMIIKITMPSLLRVQLGRVELDGVYTQVPPEFHVSKPKDQN